MNTPYLAYYRDRRGYKLHPVRNPAKWLSKRASCVEEVCISIWDNQAGARLTAWFNANTPWISCVATFGSAAECKAWAASLNLSHAPVIFLKQKQEG